MSTEKPEGVGIVPAWLKTATVVLRWSDGREQTLDFDTNDPGYGIGLDLDIEVDVVDKTPPDGNYRVMAAGTRRRMALSIAGRGPIHSTRKPSGEGAAEPVPAKEVTA